MARSIRKKPAKRSKVKATSVIALCMTAGFFLGVGLGALMSSVLLVTVLGTLLGAGVGYHFDRKNGIAYTKRTS